MKIYLAGPDVFLPDALQIGRQKIEICRRHGIHAADIRVLKISLGALPAWPQVRENANVKS